MGFTCQILIEKMTLTEISKKIVWGIVVSGLLAINMPTTAHAAVTETFTNLTGKDGTLNEFYRATGNVSVSSKGVGLSNPRSGTIEMSAIPEDITIKQAWLYWGGYSNNISEALLGEITFEGAVINSGSSPAAVTIGIQDPGGNRSKRRLSLRADVSSLISADGNGAYDVSVSHRKNDTFGASLVIVYEDLNVSNGTVVINDGMVMIGKKFPDRVSGSSFTSTVDGLSLGNPPKGDVTIIVSEGTAVDNNEFTFEGASSHNYGDFAANIDGRVWDDRTVDVSSYLNAGTTSVSSTLTDRDDKVAYSHYYVNIFRTSFKASDLSQSTMTVSTLTPNPEEAISYTVTIPNTGQQIAENSKFKVYINGNTDFIRDSVILNGVPKSNDTREVTFYGGREELEVEIGNINPGSTATIVFQVKMHDGLDHNLSETQQGFVVADTWSSLTDGDGSPSDGLDAPTITTVTGGRVTNVPSGFTVYLKDAPAIDPTSVARTGVNTVVGMKNGGKVFEIALDLNDDKAITGVTAEKDLVNKKGLVHWGGGLPTGVDSYTLIIPTESVNDTVRLCLGATSLDQIEPGCGTTYENVTEELLFSNGSTQSGITCRSTSSTEWACTGVTGSGGEGEGEEGGWDGEVPEFLDITLLMTLLILFYFLEKEKCLN